MKNKTLKIIEEAFKNKVDKGGAPYIKHLLQVAENTKLFTKDKEVYTIALLHDLLEDSKEWNEEKLRNIYSKRIVDTCLLLTHKKEISYEKYINLLSKNRDALIVKLSDLKHNLDITRLKKINSKDIEKIKKYHNTYQKLFKIFNSKM